MSSQVESLEKLLNDYLPPDALKEANRILYGTPCRFNIQKLLIY